MTALPPTLIGPARATASALPLSSLLPPRPLTVPEAAAYVGLSKSTLDKLRVYGGGPRFIRLGRAIRYRLEDLEAYMADRLFASTSEYGGKAIH